MNPLVSIIVPVYNVSEYIERCIHSIISQTYSNIECIIVDDVTPDDSIEKCEKIISTYNGTIAFRIIRRDENGGLSAARNTGTLAARGDYLFYIDSDDDISSNCIEKMVSFVSDDESIEMVQGNYLKISDNEKELGKSEDARILNNDGARDFFLNKRIINEFVWNKLLKRSFIIENNLFNKKGLINQDLLWMYHVLKYLKHAVLLNEATYFYRIRPGSIVTSSSKKRQGNSYSIIYNEILDSLTPGKEKEELYGYLYNFSYAIVSYKKHAPELKPVYHRYMQMTKKYGAWYYRFVLTIANVFSVMGITPQLLKSLNRLRIRFK